MGEPSYGCGDRATVSREFLPHLRYGIYWKWNCSGPILYRHVLPECQVGMDACRGLCRGVRIGLQRTGFAKRDATRARTFSPYRFREA
jgi:hypothetical protein